MFESHAEGTGGDAAGGGYPREPWSNSSEWKMKVIGKLIFVEK